MRVGILLMIGLQAEVFELQARCTALENQNSVLQTAAVTAGRSLPATAFLPVELSRLPPATLTQSLPVSLAVSPVSSMQSNPVTKGSSLVPPSLVIGTVEVDVPLDPSLMVRVETPVHVADSATPHSPQLSTLSPKSGASEFTPWRAPSGSSSQLVKEMSGRHSGVAEAQAISAATSVVTQGAPPRLTGSVLEVTESESGTCACVLCATVHLTVVVL
jgi:hypothetical protein